MSCDFTAGEPVAAGELRRAFEAKAATAHGLPDLARSVATARNAIGKGEGERSRKIVPVEAGALQFQTSSPCGGELARRLGPGRLVRSPTTPSYLEVGIVASEPTFAHQYG